MASDVLGVSLRIIERIKTCVTDKDETGLSKLLNSVKNRARRPSVMSREENELAKMRIIEGAIHGFALLVPCIRDIMAGIANDGRHTYNTEPLWQI